MADRKISALGTDDSITGTETFAVNEAGTTKKASLSQVETFLGTIRGQLGSNLDTTSTTMVKATGLDKTLETGTWDFEYRVVFRTTDSTNGMKFGVNFSGTQTAFNVEATMSCSSATTGNFSYLGTVTAEPGFRMKTGGTVRAPSTTVDIIRVSATDVADGDCLIVIRGLLVVTVSGDLQLYYGSEVATTGTQTLSTTTSVWIQKIA